MWCSMKLVMQKRHTDEYHLADQRSTCEIATQRHACWHLFVANFFWLLAMDHMHTFAAMHYIPIKFIMDRDSKLGFCWLAFQVDDRMPLSHHVNKLPQQYEALAVLLQHTLLRGILAVI